MNRIITPAFVGSEKDGVTQGLAFGHPSEEKANPWTVTEHAYSTVPDAPGIVLVGGPTPKVVQGPTVRTGCVEGGVGGNVCPKRTPAAATTVAAAKRMAITV
jgi:hypothetical protein